MRISSTLQEVGSDVLLSIKEYNREWCKYFQLEEERAKFILIDSDDILWSIFVDSLEIEILKFDVWNWIVIYLPNLCFVVNN